MRFKGVSEVVVNAIRGGWKDLVHDMGGVDRAERICGVTKGQISIYGAKHGDSLPSLCTVLAAELDTGFSHVTEAMAHANGFILVPAKELAEGDLATLMAKVGQEAGEVFARYAAALADGDVCAEDKLGIVRELEDVIQAAHRAIGNLRGKPVAVATRGAEDAA